MSSAPCRFPIPGIAPPRSRVARSLKNRPRRRRLGLVDSVSNPAVAALSKSVATAFTAELGTGLDPFLTEINFLVGSSIFEDVRVTDNKGDAALIANKAYREVFAGILGVEIYYAGIIRTRLHRLGAGTQAAALAISDLRAELAEGGSDEGVTTGARQPRPHRHQPHRLQPHHLLGAHYHLPRGQHDRRPLRPPRHERLHPLIPSLLFPQMINFNIKIFYILTSLVGFAAAAALGAPILSPLPISPTLLTTLPLPLPLAPQVWPATARATMCSLPPGPLYQQSYFRLCRSRCFHSRHHR
jgi:hypothetical protein